MRQVAPVAHGGDRAQPAARRRQAGGAGGGEAAAFANLLAAWHQAQVQGPGANWDPGQAPGAEPLAVWPGGRPVLTPDARGLAGPRLARLDGEAGSRGGSVGPRAQGAPQGGPGRIPPDTEAAAATAVDAGAPETPPAESAAGTGGAGEARSTGPRMDPQDTARLGPPGAAPATARGPAGGGPAGGAGAKPVAQDGLAVVAGAGAAAQDQPAPGGGAPGQGVPLGGVPGAAAGNAAATAVHPAAGGSPRAGGTLAASGSPPHGVPGTGGAGEGGNGPGGAAAHAVPTGPAPGPSGLATGHGLPAGEAAGSSGDPPGSGRVPPGGTLASGALPAVPQTARDPVSPGGGAAPTAGAGALPGGGPQPASGGAGRSGSGVAPAGGAGALPGRALAGGTGAGPGGASPSGSAGAGPSGSGIPAGGLGALSQGGFPPAGVGAAAGAATPGVGSPSTGAGGPGATGSGGGAAAGGRAVTAGDPAGTVVGVNLPAPPLAPPVHPQPQAGAAPGAPAWPARVPVAEWASHVAQAATPGRRTLRLHLEPAGLGPVEVRLAVDAGGRTAVALHVAHGGAQALLEQDQGRLREALAQRGLVLDRFQVAVDPGLAGGAGGGPGGTGGGPGGGPYGGPGDPWWEPDRAAALAPHRGSAGSGHPDAGRVGPRPGGTFHPSRRARLDYRA